MSEGEQVWTPVGVLIINWAQRTRQYTRGILRTSRLTACAEARARTEENANKAAIILAEGEGTASSVLLRCEGSETESLPSEGMGREQERKN